MPQQAPEATLYAVAHELNNVLAVVKSYTHFARQPTTDERRSGDLMRVAAAAERAGALVDWLASKSEVTARATDELSANEFVSMISARLQELIDPATSLEIMRVREDVWFRASAQRLEHVVMSLVLAASQRSSETAFKFAVERAVFVEGQQPDLAPGDYVRLVIRCVSVTLSSVWKEPAVSGTDHLAALLAPLADLLRTMHGKFEVVASHEGEVRFEILPARRRSASSIAPATAGNRAKRSAHGLYRGK